MKDERALLVLDLDETLVYASEVELARGECDFRVGEYFVYRRPYLGEFLERVGVCYRLGVWTSSNAAYARGVVEAVFGGEGEGGRKLEFVWSRGRCTAKWDFEMQEYCHIKQLSKLRKRLRYDLRRVLVVDDSPDKHRRNYGNLVRVSEWTGDPADDELRDLAGYLERIAGCENYRGMEKRGWRGGRGRVF